MQGALEAWREPRRASTIVAVLAVWLALVANLALWRALAGMLAGPGGFAVGIGVAAVLLLVHLSLLGLTAWGRTAKPLWMLIVFAAAVAQHFMLRFGALIDASMIASAWATSRRELGDLMSTAFVLDTLLVAGPPIAWLWQVTVLPEPKAARAGRAALLAGASLLVGIGAVVLMYRPLAPLVRNHMELRYLPNPVVPIVSAARAALRSRRAPTAGALTVVDGVALGPSHAAAEAPPPLLLLVIGETARADHVGLNGYARDTTPELARRDVTSFTDVRSCGTFTLVSVPCMFSPLGRARFDRHDVGAGNLLDVAQAAGLAVLWLDNQDGCKDVCDRVPTASTRDLAGTPAAARLCRGGECLDDALLEGLDGRIAALPEARRRRGVLVVLHQMGSHGPAYSRRSAPAQKRFWPECTQLALDACSHEALVNAYDNSIAGTDHMLAAAIDWLQARDGPAATALVYASDHGESLGEFGLYLHGLPYAIAPEAQKHVPLIAWLGATMRARDGVDRDCERSRAIRPASHDHLYHSVLGLLDVTSPTYRRELDLWAGCRKAAAS